MSFCTRAPNYRQALSFQRIMVEKAKDPEISAAALASLASAWKSLEELKRVIRGVGAPKSVPARNAGGKAMLSGRAAVVARAKPAAVVQPEPGPAIAPDSPQIEPTPGRAEVVKAPETDAKAP